MMPGPSHKTFATGPHTKSENNNSQNELPCGGNVSGAVAPMFTYLEAPGGHIVKHANTNQEHMSKNAVARHFNNNGPSGGQMGVGKEWLQRCTLGRSGMRAMDAQGHDTSVAVNNQRHY